MGRAKVTKRTFAQFKPVPPDLSSDDKHLFGSLARFKDFLERILFKWNESFCIEAEAHRFVMYFCRRKAWGAASIPVQSGESLIYTEGRLCVEFFKVLQKLLRNDCSISWHSLSTQHGRDLLADYCVNLLQLLDTAQVAQGGSVRDHKPMIVEFWKVYEPRITERVTYFMSNGGEVPIDTPLSWRRVEQWRIWRNVIRKKQTTYSSKLPRAAASKAFAVISKEREVDIFGQSGFSYPFTEPFPPQSLPRFTYSRSPGPDHVKVFFGELRRLLSADVHIEAHYVKVAEEKYAYLFTLYLDGWNWLVRRSEAFKEANGTGEDIRECMKAFEDEMSTGLWKDLAQALHMPQSAIDKMENGQKPVCKRIAWKAVELMQALKGWKEISPDEAEDDDGMPIWERPFWKKMAQYGWRTAGFTEEEEDADETTGIDVNGNLGAEVREEDSDEDEVEEPSKWKRKKDGEVEPVEATEENSKNLLSLRLTKDLSLLKATFKRPHGLSIYFSNILLFVEEVLSSTGMSLKFEQRLSESNEPSDIIASFIAEKKVKVFTAECKNEARKPGFQYLLAEVFWHLKEANGLDPAIIPQLETEDPMNIVRLSFFTEDYLNSRLDEMD